MIARVALLLALAASSAWAVSEQKVNEEFDCSSGGKLIVDVDFGVVEVTGHSEGKVIIDARRKIDASDEVMEKEYFAATPIVVTNEGNTVTIRSRRQGSDRSWSWRGNVNMDARYTVGVPKSFNVNLKTSGGSITANGISGEVKADTSGGKMKFGQIRGPLDARTSGGGIVLEQCDGPQTIATSGGSIDASQGSGSLDARTSGGSIMIRNFRGDTELKTSGGKLTLEGIVGNIEGRTSAGSISCVPGEPLGDVDLHTSAGSIELTLPPKAGVNVEAKTSMGKIRTEIPMIATRTSDDRLEGTLNGGGKNISLKASVGSITIKPGSEATAAAR
jgi:DUF4097 and DUF4098 domain-containing protein YvlB